ncbi:hypothetical protein KO481_26715 [Nocardia sp. NEAU-G5]|uniref:PPE family domain-containing protein n=1 Tax=Nocardia albiluteola TaxID=2842303 RepID=A0ABS6B4D6_9NOCA|nr:hypothetical protein [Nocardia albiluteola]MBU3065109.1 hypothetical protein [Nocardia albiluteola]
MQALDTGAGGVIGAHTDPVAAAASAVSQAAQNIAQTVQNGPFAHVSLPQLPADMPEVHAPEFTLSRKEFDDDHGSALGSAHLPGLGGSDTSTHAASFDGASVLGQANDALDHAQSTFGAIPGAQNVFDTAHTALNSASPTLIGAASSIQQAAAPISSALHSSDPIATLMQHGISLPAIPGIEQLFQPITSLLQSFGTGVMGALNPTQILSESSQVIQAAMQVGEGAMKTVSQVWQGKSSDSAQTASDKAQSKGQDTSQRGLDISKLTTEAAAVVQKGNVQLTTVAQSFAAQASALAPTWPTPPGQAALLATATEHLGTAVGIVNATRGELSGYTGQLTGVVNQLLGQSGIGQQAAQVAQSAAQNIAQPVMEQAQNLLSGNSDSNSSDKSSSDLATSTTSAGYNGMNGGSTSLGGSGGTGGSLSSDSLGGGTNSGGGTGTSVPGTTGTNAAAAAAASLGSATRTAGVSSPGFMGGAGAANARNTSDEEHERTVQPYQSITGDTELAGVLGEIAPDVIGQVHSDEEINGYSSDMNL